jgi:putative hydrolase of the HAD superfamily
MQRVRAVLFDYGQVLSLPPDEAAWKRMEATLGAGANELHAAYWRFRDAYDRGQLTGQTYWRSVLGALGRKMDEGSVEILLQADVDLWARPNQPMIDWAMQLQGAGMMTGVLSNLGDAMEAGLRKRHPWLNEFVHCTYSHRLGIAKPDAAIYRYAAEGFDVPVEEILFVDDREDNVAGAEAVGMIAIQYSEFAAFRAQMERAGLSELLS